MDYTNFIDNVKKEVQDIMGEGYTVTATQVKKNNGILLDGITIAGKGQSVFPAFYLNSFYPEHQKGKSIAAIAGEINAAYQEGGPQPELDLEFFRFYQQMKDRVLFKLVHYRKNQELLKEIPHIRFLNLAIVFYCKITHQLLENGTILINNSHLNMWQVTPEILYEDALRNTPTVYPAVIQTMDEVIKGLYAQELEENWGAGAEAAECIDRVFAEQEARAFAEHGTRAFADQEAPEPGQEQTVHRMYVLSNPEKLFGAAAMLYPQELGRFAEQVGASLYLLPSSVHEIIMIPDDGFQDKEALLKMVTEINDTQVDPEEVLASAIYYYDRKKSEIIRL